MIRPIYTYGHAVLRQKAKPVPGYMEDLETLVEDFFETMYKANGVGLAAPQLGMSLRMFIIDTQQMMEEGHKEDGIKQVFINPTKLSESGVLWSYEEGCLSIPNLRAEVERLSHIELEYYDVDFNRHVAKYDGVNARVIQHEYDHIEGILFTDKIKPLKKKLMQRKLDQMRKGKLSADYKIKMPKAK